jgi:hypothetical protein
LLTLVAVLLHSAAMLPTTLSELLVLSALGPWQRALPAVLFPVTSRDLTFQLTYAGHPIAHATVRATLANLLSAGLVAMVVDQALPAATTAVPHKGLAPSRWSITAAGLERLEQWRQTLDGMLWEGGNT